MSWLKRFGKNLKRDCRNITLHGCINLSESKSILEMTFWLCVQALCFVLCLWLMTIHWLRYQSRPTVTTIKSTAYPISDIPFPAVTICNSNVVHKKKINYYQTLLVNEGINETLVADFFSNLKYLIHLNAVTKVNVSQFDEIENVLNKYNINSEILMGDISHSCEDMLVQCFWSNVKYNCTQMFKVIKTGLGFCCSFNYFNEDAEDENVLEIFQKPVVADGSGMAHGISITLRIDTEQYMSTVLPFYACFVMVHPIWDYSDLSAFSVAMQPGDFGLMQLVPTVFTSDENIRSISVEDRMCWFDNEGNLKSTKDYSFTNCVMECKLRAILKLCNCAPFFYPFVRELDNTRLCSLQDVPCLKLNEVLYNSIKLTGKGAINSTICDCLPDCQYVSYDGYVNLIRASLPVNTTSIYIYYDKSWCVVYEKSMNLTWDMLLASLGGIFGLCLGGSLISIIECIFYFLKNIIMATIEGRKILPKKIQINSKIRSTGLIKFQVQPKY